MNTTTSDTIGAYIGLYTPTTDIADADDASMPRDLAIEDMREQSDAIGDLVWTMLDLSEVDTETIERIAADLYSVRQSLESL